MDGSAWPDLFPVGGTVRGTVRKEPHGVLTVFIAKTSKQEEHPALSAQHYNQ